MIKHKYDSLLLFSVKECFTGRSTAGEGMLLVYALEYKSGIAIRTHSYSRLISNQIMNDYSVFHSDQFLTKKQLN